MIFKPELRLGMNQNQLPFPSISKSSEGVETFLKYLIMIRKFNTYIDNGV